MREGRASILWALAIAAAAIALVASGCGGGSSGGETTAAPAPKSEEGGGGSGGAASTQPSSAKADFVAQANAICKREKAKGLAAITAYVKQHGGASGGASKVALLAEAIQSAFLPLVQNQIDQIRALGAPAGDEAKVDAFLEAMQEAVDTAGQGTASRPHFSQAFADAAKLAREYGLDSCAYG